MARRLCSSRRRRRRSRFSLVEARPAATPYLRLTGGHVVSRTLGIWRVRERDARRLRRAGLVRAAEPERRLRVESSAIDPLVDGEWWLASVGASSESAPGPGVPVAVIDTGVDFTHPEFAARPDTKSLNAQSVVDTLGDFHGTAVASVVGAPVNGIGMVGVYPQASLYAYDADLSGAITNTDLIQGSPTRRDSGVWSSTSASGSTRPDALLEDTVLAAVRSGALIVAASGNFGANSAADLPGRPPSRPDGRGDRSHGPRGVVLECLGQPRPRGARRRDQRGGSVPLHRRRLPVPERDELLGSDRLGRRRARLDGPQRPRQRPDLRRAPLLRDGHRAARLRPRDGLRDARHPGRARTRGAAARLDGAERRRPARPPRRPLRLRHRAAHVARAHERLRARIRRRHRGSATTSIACGCRRTATCRAGEQLRRSPAHLASRHADRHEEGAAQARDLLASRVAHVKAGTRRARAPTTTRMSARAKRRQRALPAERQDRRSREAVAAVHSAHAMPGLADSHRHRLDAEPRRDVVGRGSRERLDQLVVLRAEDSRTASRIAR